jgi:hypothetical protein
MRGVVLPWLLLICFPHRPVSTQPPRCAPTQRYDVHKFPPRCLECPRITLNPMKLYSISATVVRKQQSSIKFSPGLPHNQTCGCWRGGNQTTVDLTLNASWIVSGLSFKVDRRHWLRRFSVSASEDNTTYLEWGNYTQSNFSSAVVLFRYPIRATFLRLTVFEYVNHMINTSTGFPLRVDALVSNSEPFGCECATLPTGECCPMANMEVKNGVCVMCMDPSSIHTVMVDGCGRCKPGTRQLGSSQRCVVNVPTTEQRIGLTVTDVNTSSEQEWTAQVEATTGDSALVLFLAEADSPPPCTPPLDTSACFAVLVRDFVPVLWEVNLPFSNNSSSTPLVSRIKREINPQYIQFDRGRMVLAMNESAVRSWARCDHQCTGTLFGMFLSLGSSSINQQFGVRVITQPLVFQFFRPNAMVCGIARGGPVTMMMELHHELDRNRYLLWPTPPAVGLSIQWDEGVRMESNGTLVPPKKWASLRVFSGDRQILFAPASVVRRASFDAVGASRSSVSVEIRYGLELSAFPLPGDSEQLVTISARSKQPLRLARLSSVTAGVTTVYTASSKGFIIVDPARAIDLVVACNGGTDALVGWLGSALGLMGHYYHAEPFVKNMCALSKKVSKLYWLVPYRPMGTRRSERNEVRVLVDLI